ncbi:MAG: transposase, partial [Atopobiaceae bacterium]|nr:transposase [Atopobiaceae bacterium]
EVRDHLRARMGKKAPSMPTIRKYHDMDGVPEDPHARTAKPHAFDAEPFRSDILELLAPDPKCYMSSVYDVLVERYVETGEYEILPGSERTLRNYIRWLRETGQIAEPERRRRLYDHVDDPPAGKQPRLDFGQARCDGGLTVHFICMLLRISRYLGVCAQDHRFDSEEACVATCRFLCKIGGRVEELVIDQDSVFVGSEACGEVFATETFDAFLKEQDLRLWCRDKHDPESKGAVENSVKFVKSSFFSARRLSTIEQVRDALPGWCERSNNRIHQATFRVPAQVFAEEERPALRPPLPSVHEVAPTNLIPQGVAGQPFMQYTGRRSTRCPGTSATRQYTTRSSATSCTRAARTAGTCARTR